MTAGPRASASGERLMIARGIEAGWPRRLAARFTRARCGTCRTRQNEKPGRLSSGTGCLRVKDSNRTLAPTVANPSHVLAAGTNDGQNDSPLGAISMLMTSARRPAIRTMRGWAIDVLQNA